MSVFSACCDRANWKQLSRAAAKAASARLRNFGALKTSSNWTARAAICEQCPLRVLRRGVSYCGKPLLEQPVRDLSIDGCGCPTVSKAKSPDEHCPLDAHHRPARLTVRSQPHAHCTCKWCAADFTSR